MQNSDLTQLADSIKSAFVEALPNNLPDSVRNSIVSTYTPLCASIAQAIKNFVLTFDVKVDMTSPKYKTAGTQFIGGSRNLTTRDIHNSVIGSTTISAADITTMMNSGSSYVLELDGHLE